MTIKIETFGSIFVVALVVWYLAKQTNLAAVFTRDLRSIPQYFTTFIGVSAPSIRESGREVFRR
jgi:hypothetical protein